MNSLMTRRENRTARKGKSARQRRLARLGVGAGLLAAAMVVVRAEEGTAAAPSAPLGEPTPSKDTEGPLAYRKMSLEELMSLDITSVSKHSEPYRDAPAAIQVITEDEIRRSGATSIPEALRLADNLEVARKNSHDWAISARGFNTELSNKLLVLIDGRTVYTPLFSGVFWDEQDYLLADIDRIEVISGPGGTLWGANAVNGVINITTKSAKETQGTYLEAGGGSTLRDFGGLRYGGSLGTNTFYRIYGKYSDQANEVIANGTGASDGWSRGQGGFRVDSEPSPQNLITLQGDVYASGEHVPTGGSAKTSGGNLLGRFSHTFSEDSDLSLQVYYDRTHLYDPVPKSAFAPAGILVNDLDTYDVDFQHRLGLADWNHLVWGLGYRFTRDASQNAPALAFRPPVLNQDLFSGFVQDEIKIMRQLSLTLGTKVEHNDYTGFEVEPSARVQWDVATNHMAWGAVSRAVRTPSRIDRDAFEPNPPPRILGDSPHFLSETLIAYELGYRAQIGPRFATSVSGFYNEYDDVRSLGFTPATIVPLFFQNNLEGSTYGLELSASYQVTSWWRLHGGYDLLKEHLRVKPGQVDLNHALNETSDPQQQFSLRSSMDLPGNVEFDPMLRWVDTLHNNNGGVVGTVPSYFELDVRVAWHITKHLELAVVGQSLLHDHHAEYGLPSPNREEIERSVYGKLTWRF